MRIFHVDNYAQLAEANREAYRNGDPFPHIVLDDFLPLEVCEQLLQEFPNPRRRDWERIDSYDQKKLAV
jgi:hypothetical protein